jgi:hypothetical protein
VRQEVVVKKFGPILAMLGVLAAVYLQAVILLRLSQIAARELNFLPLVVYGQLTNLVVALLLVGLAWYLWSQKEEHRLAAWIYLVTGFALEIIPILFIAGISPSIFLSVFFHLWEALSPTRPGGLEVLLIASMGLFHLLHS